VANVAYTSRETGLARGFAHYRDYVISPGELIEASSLGRNVFNSPRLRPLMHWYDIPGRRDAAHITRDFLRWQAGLEGRPFFALLNLYDAHEPYLPPPPFDSLAGGRRDLGMIRVMANSHGRMAERDARQEMTADERAAEEGAYDGAIASMDDVLARTFAELERRGRLEHTLVIVTADHGEQFGEHGLFSHANSLFLPVLHVPLVMALPGKLPAGERTPIPVTLRDLAATILALVSPQDSAALPGHAFVGTDGRPVATVSPVLAHILPPPQQPGRYVTAHGEMFSLISGGWHYIKGPQGAESLFDMVRDSAELTNVVTQPVNAARRDSLRQALDAAVRRR
jgi:arylsulfatase A-like enzyme